MKFTTKYKLSILSIRDNVSRVKAISALSNVTGLTIKQSKYFTDHLPQLLSESGCESFKSIVMTESEVVEVENKLSPFFEIWRSHVSENILSYGMTIVPPWEN